MSKFVLLTAGLVFLLATTICWGNPSSNFVASEARKVYQAIEKEEMNTYDISPTYAKKQAKAKVE